MWSARIGELSPKRDGDHRSPYQRDRARVMHSAAFRRLQAKTQVMGVGLSDFFRTRLTHSLEAAQIGAGIAAQLNQKHHELAIALGINEHLIETICLAHDIGHPPFGHGGEIALHYMMSEHGGFEGNGQTFRILCKLEAYTEHSGMNLARRTLLGVLKYPNFMSNLRTAAPQQAIKERRSSKVKASLWHPPKALFDCDREVFDWVLEPLSVADKTNFMVFKSIEAKHSRTLHKSFDCSIMELADDIAYAIHDLEDAVVMDLVKQKHFIEEVCEPIAQSGLEGLSSDIFDLQNKLFSELPYARKNAIGALVNYFITAIEIYKQNIFAEDLLDYQAVLPKNCEYALSLFKQFVFSHVIRKPDIQQLEYKGQQIVMSLFDAFSSEPERLLPFNTKKRWQNSNEQEKPRVIADYISGMTDEYANRVYTNLFLP